jgi:hypothetical protein
MAKISTAVPTDGNYIIKYLPVVAGEEGPTLAEWNAGEDLTYYFTADGWTPGGDQATVTDDRLTADQTFEQPGKETNSLDTIYVTNPESPADDVAAITLVKGARGFFGVRKGMPHDEDAAADQKVNLHPISAGVQRDLPPEANGVFKIGQKQFITNEVRRNVAILAA